MRRLIDKRVAMANAEARAARAEVMATIGELRHRLDPRVMAGEAAEGAFTRATALVDDLSSTARSRPWLLAIGATLFGIAVTLRTGILSSAETVHDDETNAGA